jgi:tRNA modification GTPase
MADVIDTIAALATPPGQGGVGIIRLSGPAVPEMAEAICGRLPAPRLATLARFSDQQGRLIDQGLALYFPAPHSFTGEHVLELHGHGGPVVLDMLLRALLELGARLARPGEFSERAFLNGKLDLSQAEAVADLIESGSEWAARGAVRSLQGEFSRRVHHLVEGLTALRMYVEAAIDFPEEEVDFLADASILDNVDALTSELADLRDATRQGCLLREGMTITLAGRPNAGKSSLLNLLSGSEVAIVTELPGTTRDVLRSELQIDGLPVHIIDLAGLRESGDVVESEGVRRARSEIARSDRVLVMVDDSRTSGDDLRELLAELPENLPRTIVRNKIDLSGHPAELIEGAHGAEIYLSAKTGTGVEILRAHLKDCIGYQPAGEGVFIARRRHLDALERAARHLRLGRERLLRERAGELLAEELREAQQDLAEITGEFTNEDLLGRIFASFCIGK